MVSISYKDRSRFDPSPHLILNVSPPSLLIFSFLRKSLLSHNTIKLLRANLPILIRVRPLDHLEQFCVGHGLAEFFGYAFEVSESYLTGLIVIEEVEDFLDVFAGVFVAHLGGGEQSERWGGGQDY